MRSKGCGLGSSSHWIMNAAIANIFPIIAAYNRAAPFWLFAAMTMLAFLRHPHHLPGNQGSGLLEGMSEHLGLH